jgi:cbb3-type cytochrome oxidase maturation protein
LFDLDLYGRLRSGEDTPVDILYLLLPLSVVLVLLILGVLGWSVWRGQFDNVEQEGVRILDEDQKGSVEPP